MAGASIPPPAIGWPLLQVPDAQGRLAYPTLQESVRQTIEVILRTRPGEQLMRPEFGAGLEELLHEPNSLETRARIRDLVAESLERWERRIIVDRLDVTEVPDHPNHVRIEIGYRIRRTGTAQQVGVTVELSD
jgi:phage baseplate assembly protein W